MGGDSDDAIMRAIIYALNSQSIPTVTGNPTLPVSAGNLGCSSFTATNASGQPLFDRSLEWGASPMVLIFCQPPTGYAFVAGVLSSVAGYTTDLFTKTSLYDKIAVIGAPYGISDGMNEKGVCMSVLSVDHAQPPAPDPNKVTISAEDVMLLVLNYAQNLSEALKLISGYNMYFSKKYNTQPHWLISDAEGNSAIVEFSGGSMIVSRSIYPWQAVTNYVICENQPAADNRMEYLYLSLGQKNGILDDEVKEGMELLAGVSSANTVWSEVFNLETGDFYIAIRSNFTSILKYHIDMSY